MESGDGVRVKTAILEEHGRLHSNSPLLGEIRHPYEDVNLHSSLATANPPSSVGERSLLAGVRLMESIVTKKMKIIQFPVNIDKFTGFFDKYLKSGLIGIKMIINYISVVMKIDSSRKQIFYRNLSNKKSFFAPRICPHYPAFPLSPIGRQAWRHPGPCGMVSPNHPPQA